MLQKLRNWLNTPAVQQMLPVIGASIPMIILGIAFLSIPLAATQNLDLTTEQTASWILGVYAFAGILGLIMSWHYRQPLFYTGNAFIMIFVASLADNTPYGELIGACMLAGVTVTIITLLGLTERLSTVIPTPVVLGLLAGAVMSFVSGIFTAMGESPVMIGGTFIAYLLGRRLLGKRVPAILPALIVGLMLAAMTSQLQTGSERISLPAPVLIRPIFTANSILSLTPVFVVLIVLQANLPSIIFLRSQGYSPAERTINLVSGVFTTFGALLGPLGVSLSLPAVSIAAGNNAGAFHLRHRAVYIASVGIIIIGLLAGIAAYLAQIVPATLLLSLAGLAMVDILTNALQKIVSGPSNLGAIFAFAITLSNIELLGFGTYFWAIVIGTGVSMLFERDVKK